MAKQGNSPVTRCHTAGTPGSSLASFALPRWSVAIQGNRRAANPPGTVASSAVTNQPIRPDVAKATVRASQVSSLFFPGLNAGGLQKKRSPLRGHREGPAAVSKCNEPVAGLRSPPGREPAAGGVGGTMNQSARRSRRPSVVATPGRPIQIASALSRFGMAAERSGAAIPKSVRRLCWHCVSHSVLYVHPQELQTADPAGMLPPHCKHAVAALMSSYSSSGDSLP